MRLHNVIAALRARRSCSPLSHTLQTSALPQLQSHSPSLPSSSRAHHNTTSLPSHFSSSPHHTIQPTPTTPSSSSSHISPQTLTASDQFTLDNQNISTFDTFTKHSDLFTFGHFNACSLKKRLPIVKSLLHSSHLCFLGVSESRFSSSDHLSHIPGYTGYSYPHPSSSYRSLAVFVRNDISRHCTPTNHIVNDKFSYTTFKVSIHKHSSFHLSLVHIHCSTQPHLIKKKLNHLMQNIPNNIIFGDMNSKHPSLGGAQTDKKGSTISSLVTSLGYTPLLPNTHTHSSVPSHSSQSTIDHTLLPPNIQSYTPQSFTVNHTGSDHKPILIILDHHLSTQTQPPHNSSTTPPFDLTKATKDHWSAYNTTLQSLISSIPITQPNTIHDIDHLSETLTHCIVTAATLSFPENTKHLHKHPTSAPHSAQPLVRKSHTLRRLIASTPQTSPLHKTYKKLLNKTSKSISKAKLHKKRLINQSKLQHLHSLKHHNPKEFWINIKSITEVPTKSKIHPLINGTSTTLDPSTQANIHAQHLISTMTPLPDIHSSPSQPSDPAQVQAEVNFWFDNSFTPLAQSDPFTSPHTINSFINNPSTSAGTLEQMADPVTPSDVETSLAARVARAIHSSPGHDHITYSLLKNAPPHLIQLLTNLFNASLFLGYLPQSAKTSHITVIPKPHLDHKHPKNYRPISLTPTIWKILEGIIHSRITHHMEHNKLINPSQFGFRQNHSTTDAVITMIHHILANKSMKLHSLGFFADISKAFDKVCIKSLMYKLKKLRFPHIISRWIYQFLTHRTSFVKHFGALSDPFSPLAGIPQGSILGPLLFLLYVNDMPTTPFTHTSQFADDTAATSYSLKSHGAAYHMQSFINSLTSWADTWKITLHPEKSSLMSYFLTADTHHHDIISHNSSGTSSVIPYTSVQRYLGVHIDHNLTFKEHIQHVSRESLKRFFIVCRLYRYSPHIDPHLMIHLYKAYIRPLMDYCAPIFLLSPLCSSYHLEVLQNRILRHFLNLDRYTSLIDIRHQSRCTSLKERWNSLTVKYILDKASLDLPISRLILQQIFQPTSKLFHIISQLIHQEAPDKLPALRSALNTLTHNP